MKKLAIAALLATTLLTNAACGENGDVVATYSGGKVTSEQVMTQFKTVIDAQPESKDKKFSELDKNFQELLVKSYVNQKLFEQEIDRLKIRSSEEFKKKMKNMEDQLAQQELIDMKVKELVTDTAIDAEYKKFADSLRGQNEIKVSHILVESEEIAKDALTKLDKGAKFEDLAKELSKDENSKASGGMVGYLMKGQVVPEFEAAAFALRKGEISAPIKTQFGWHIIKVTDVRPVQVPTKEQAANNIKTKLSREILDKYIKDLNDAAKVELKLK
jgi:peptidyl-prolyl cis-trans isomerase C